MLERRKKAAAGWVTAKGGGRNYIVERGIECESQDLDPTVEKKK